MKGWQMFLLMSQVSITHTWTIEVSICFSALNLFLAAWCAVKEGA